MYFGYLPRSVNSISRKRRKWKKLQDKFKAKPITSVYNYYKITLTKPMETLLNRGLNFCVTPDKVNAVQIEVDLNKFFFVFFC